MTKRSVKILLSLVTVLILYLFGVSLISFIKYQEISTGDLLICYVAGLLTGIIIFLLFAWVDPNYDLGKLKDSISEKKRSKNLLMILLGIFIIILALCICLMNPLLSSFGVQLFYQIGVVLGLLFMLITVYYDFLAKVFKRNQR